MRRALSALVACAAVLGLAAQTAAADIVDRTVIRCEYDAQWTVHFDPFGGSYADQTYDTGAATNSGCKRLEAIVHDDGDFHAFNRDWGQAATLRFDLTGEWGDPVHFVGVAARPDAPSRGPLVIANDQLNAVITYTDPTGMQAVNVHRGTGSCGTNCFKTHSVVSVATF
jgi:hypothetical protein